MSDQWSATPGDRPPTPPSVPPGWAGAPGPAAAPPQFGAGPPLPPMPTPSPAGPSGPSRTALVIIAMGVVIVLLAAGLTFALIRTSDDVVATAPTTSTTVRKGTTSTTARPTTTTEAPAPSTTRAPTTTVPAGPAPTQAEVQAVVDELVPFVEKQRGLTFKEPVKVELLDDAAFNDRLLADFDKSKEDLDKTASTLKALGLVDPKVDVVAASKSLLSNGVLGFYDPETKALVVRGRQLTPYTKQTLAHELVHALDSQWFDLVRKDLETAKDESVFGFKAVVEGNARRIENVYEQQMSPADKAARDKEEAEYAQAATDAMGDVPLILVSLLSAPYELGPPLIKAILASGGNDALGAAITTPPTTSTQVIHPDKFLAKVPRVPVDKPQPDGKEVTDGVFGELMTSLTLADGATALADQAAEGWAGDWYVVWQDANKADCIRIDYKMVSDKDLTELETAYKTWAQKHKGATIEKKGDLVEVTRCSSGGGGGRSPL